MESEEDDEFTEDEFKPQISLAIEFRAGRHNNRIFACSITCCIEGPMSAVPPESASAKLPESQSESRPLASESDEFSSGWSWSYSDFDFF